MFFVIFLYQHVRGGFLKKQLLWNKEEDDMSKSKGKRDISPGKKPGPLTKKERKERKKKRKEKQVLR